MKTSSKVYEHINKNFYLPQDLEEVSKLFYVQIVENLGLAENFKNSFISQMSKINGIAQNEVEFRELVKKAWKGFFQNIEPIHLFTIVDDLERQRFQDFVQNVMMSPKQYELAFVKELLEIYESYLQSNRGLAQVISRHKVKLIITKLNWSKFIKQFDQLTQQRLHKFFVDIYLKKVDTIDQIFLDDFEQGNFLNVMFNQLFDQQESIQGIVLNQLKYMIQKTLDELKNSIGLGIEILTQFYFICIDKEKFLYEKWEPKPIMEQKEITDIIRQIHNNQPLKDILKNIVAKLTQKIDFRKAMKELITIDIYASKNEQLILPILKDIEINDARNQRRSIDNQDYRTQFEYYIKSNNFTKNERLESIIYNNIQFEIYDDQKGKYIIKNKQNGFRKQCDNLKEILEFAKHYHQF